MLGEVTLINPGVVPPVCRECRIPLCRHWEHSIRGGKAILACHQCGATRDA